MLGNIVLTLGVVLLIIAVSAAIVLPIIRSSERKERASEQLPDLADEALDRTRAEVLTSARQKLNVQ